MCPASKDLTNIYSWTKYIRQIQSRLCAKEVMLAFKCLILGKVVSLKSFFYLFISNNLNLAYLIYICLLSIYWFLRGNRRRLQLWTRFFRSFYLTFIQLTCRQIAIHDVIGKPVQCALLMSPARISFLILFRWLSVKEVRKYARNLD